MPGDEELLPRDATDGKLCYLYHLIMTQKPRVFR